MTEPKIKIGDKVMLADGRGPFEVKWVTKFYKKSKYWLHEIGGVFDERQLSWHDDCTESGHGN